MALLLVPGAEEGQLELYEQPSSSPETGGPSHVFELTPEDFPTLLGTERVGSWIFVQTREHAGWAMAVDLLPAGLPCSCIISDELPAESMIRVRSAPQEDGTVITALRPGDRIEVVGVQGDWYNIRVSAVEAWLKRCAGDIALAFPLIPKLYAKHNSLPFGSSLRIRSEPSTEAPVIGMTTEQFVLGIEADSSWVRIIREGATTEEWMQLVSDANVQLLESCPGYKTNIVQISDVLPEQASLRVREQPSTTARVVHVIGYKDVIAVSEVVEGWAHVVSAGALGWVLTISDGCNIVQPHKPKGSAFSPGKKSRTSFGVTTITNAQKIHQSPLPIAIEKAEEVDMSNEVPVSGVEDSYVALQDGHNAVHSTVLEEANETRKQTPTITKPTDLFDERPMGGNKGNTEAISSIPTDQGEVRDATPGAQTAIPVAVNEKCIEDEDKSVRVPISFDDMPVGGIKSSASVENCDKDRVNSVDGLPAESVCDDQASHMILSSNSFDEKALPALQRGGSSFVKQQMAFAIPADDKPDSVFSGAASALLSYDPNEQLSGIKQVISLLDSADDIEEALIVVNGVWLGLTSCLQDANSDVSEEALSCVHIICGRRVLGAEHAESLQDLLVHKMFPSKRPQTIADSTYCTSFLLENYAESVLPILLKGTMSRNLSSGLQSLVCILKSLGTEIKDLPPELLSSMVDQLLRVVATAKVGLIVYSTLSFDEFEVDYVFSVCCAAEAEIYCAQGASEGFTALAT